MSRHSSIQVILCAGLLASLPLTTNTSSASISVGQLARDVLAHHPELRHYEAEIEAARAGRRTASAWADPQLGIDLGRKRVGESGTLISGEGTAWSVSLAQTFEWPGRISLRKAIADKELALAELGLAQFRATLESRVRELAFRLTAAREQAAAAIEVADRIRALRDVLLSREPGGINPLLEIRAIESTELVLQRRAADAVLAVNAVLVELNMLRGAPLDAAVELEPIKVIFHEPPGPADILATARQHNFQLRARMLELERHESIERLARSDRYPSFTVAPFYAEENAIESEKTFGVGVSLPLPVSGRARSQVDASSARRDQAAAAAAAAKLQFEREVYLAMQEYVTRRNEMLRWSPDAVERFREAAEQADHHFRQGAVPLATYITLQTAYLDAVETFAQTRRDALAAAFDLERLTGNQLKLAEAQP